jgi:hypothetical protein
MEKKEDEWTFGQQLLLVKLKVCLEKECETILKVYEDIQKEKKKGMDYWFHPRFVKPLTTFVNWHNEQLEQQWQQQQQLPKDWKVKNMEARAVLDKIHDEKQKHD